MEPANPVSCAANTKYIRSLKVLAARRGIRVADIVRSALDQVYGEEISQTITETELLRASVHPYTDDKSAQASEN